MLRTNSIYVALFFGLVVVALVVGTLLQTGKPPESTPTEWNAPSVASGTPDPGVETPGWWGTEVTKPSWPTDRPTNTPGGPTETPGSPGLSTPDDWPTMPGTTWEPTWTQESDQP